MGRRPIHEIRIWSVQDRRTGKRYARPWIVRWSIDGKTFQRGHRTRAEADGYRSLLLVAQRDGEEFDLSTGEPLSWSPSGSDLAVHSWARRWLLDNWDEWQPRTRASAIEGLARFVPLLTRSGAPDLEKQRRYLLKALAPEAEQVDSNEAWLNKWCLTLGQLDRQVLAEAEQKLGIGVKGEPLASKTATRFRTVAHSCIRRAVDLEIIEKDPWPPIARGAHQRKARKARKEIDTKSLPDPATMRRILAAMVSHQPGSSKYRVMTAVMYYAGLRPSEVVMLRTAALTLPEGEWGVIDVVEADISFDESGEPKTGRRTVPIPPILARDLRQWISEHDFADRDLLFRTRTGKRPTASNWSRTWHRGLEKVGHPSLRLYDCRHAAATTWLAAGVPLGEVARRLGHSVDVLVSTYVGALKGDEAAANRMIERFLDDAA